MAQRNAGRDGYSRREANEREEGDSSQRENYDRRGWREGSDYYGNNPQRYGEQGQVTNRSFNDRWENSYGGDVSYTDRGQRQQFEQDMGSFRGVGPRNYRRSDERIREEVCECLTDDPRINATNVDVTVKDGEVTLSGNVNSRDQKRRAEDLAESIGGVRDVLNSLKVIASSDRETELRNWRSQGNGGAPRSLQ
jgi:osmotically-inducible protein OsmY